MQHITQTNTDHNLSLLQTVERWYEAWNRLKVPDLLKSSPVLGAAYVRACRTCGDKDDLACITREMAKHICRWNSVPVTTRIINTTRIAFIDFLEQSC